MKSADRPQIEPTVQPTNGRAVVADGSGGGLIGWVQRQSAAVLFTLLMLTLAGIPAALRLPVGLFPDVDVPRLVVLGDSGEQPAEQVLTALTRPLEEAAHTLPGVETVRSVTGRGSTELSVRLRAGTDIVQAQQQLQAKLAALNLPAGATATVERMNATVFPVEGLSLVSSRHGLADLRLIAEKVLRPALLRVPDVAQVIVVGGRSREMVVTLDPAKIAAYHLAAAQVADALARTNLLAAPGRFRANHRMYLTLVDGRFRSPDEIGRTVIATGSAGTGAVTVADVATVAPGVEEPSVIVTADGQEAVLINLIRQPSGSTVTIRKGVADALARLGPTVPGDITIRPFYDQGEFILDSLTSARDAILIGVGLAMLVLVLFLRSIRVTLVAALAVPVTFAITLLLLKLAGQSLNIMTLGGLAAAVGLVIDDTIVVIEHAFARLNAKGAAADSTAVGGSLSGLLPAILGSTAATLVIHLPFAFLSGLTGSFLAALSLTMVFALTTSFIVSITLVPLLVGWLVRPEDAAREARREHRAAGSRTRRAYLATLGAGLRHAWLVVPVGVLLLVATGWVGRTLQTGFMPEMDEGSFVLDYASPPGTSLDETNRMLLDLERAMMQVPEVETYSRRTGTQMGFFLTEPNQGDVLVRLKRDRSRTIDEVISDVRRMAAERQPALQVEFGQVLGDLVGDMENTPEPVEVKLYGPDVAALESRAADVAALLETVPGVVDVFNGVVISGPSLDIRVDPDRAARFGLSADSIAAQLEIALRGVTPTDWVRGERLIPIRVRYPDRFRTDLDALLTMPIAGPTGATIPLGQVAAIHRIAGVSEISRENLQPMVAVTARLEGRDLGSAIREIQGRISREIAPPAGGRIGYGGTFESQQSAFRNLLYVLAAGIGLVSLVLLVSFRTARAPLAILWTTALSLTGVVAALRLTGTTFNLISFVGAIMIVGIVAENAIFLLHAVEERQASGDDLTAALLHGSTDRARPILMTALAAIAALLPLALGLGTGAQQQQPLAIAVIGGFATSSVLLLFALPMTIRLLGRER